MWSTPSLPDLKPGVVVLDRVLSMGQVEMFGYLTVCKQISSDLFQMLPTNYLFTNHIQYICISRIWH